MTIANAATRSFYETEAAREGWSCRELERQIASHLYDRLAASRDKDVVLALAHQGQEVITPQDVVKDPLVLEFLGLQERPHWRERDLEQAIIDHLQEFMLELGKGFSFVARQKRITLDGDHFFVDLVLYNRLLRSSAGSELTPAGFSRMTGTPARPRGTMASRCARAARGAPGAPCRGGRLWWSAAGRR
ncbi:MAG: YhcG family protein [bacterium]|nr:YhcG family protein [bacterium]